MARDLAHVPHHGALGVEVGRADQQHAPAPILAGDLDQHGVVDVAGDEGLERGRVRERRAAEKGGEDLRRHQLGGLVLGPDRLELAVVAGAEEGERGDDRAGADPGDELELGPVAALRPACQQARPERAVAAATRKGEHVDDRPAVAVLAALTETRHVGKPAAHLRSEVGRHVIGPGAHTGQAADLGDLGRGGVGDRHARDGERAAGKRDRDKQQTRRAKQCPHHDADRLQLLSNPAETVAVGPLGRNDGLGDASRSAMLGSRQQVQ